jgi:regulatory protein
VGKAQNQEATVAEARAAACRYLARREHSCKELAEKLFRKGLPSGVVDAAIAELAEEGLVSDRRFAEAYTRSRVSSLYGPFKIRADLARKGIDPDLVERTLAPYEEEWIGSACRWIMKRAAPDDLDRETRARLYRSGTNRGFSHEQMMRAFDHLRSDCLHHDG